MKAWWRRRTLRFRLAAWYAVGGAVLCAGFSATMYFYVADRMARPLDFLLRQDLAEIRGRLRVGGDGEVRWDAQPLPLAAVWDRDDPWFELWDEHSQLVCRLWPFAETRVEQLPVAPGRLRETISVFNVARDLRLRVLSVPYPVPGRAEPWMIRVLSVHQPNADALGALRWIIA
ncbi:MAG: hypothetical protein RLZZ15_1206, partial [Verrucomicrobiota bacterium]